MIQTLTFGLKSFLFTARPHKDFEIAILQDITSINKTFHTLGKNKNSNFFRSNSNFSILTPTLPGMDSMNPVFKILVRTLHSNEMETIWPNRETSLGNLLEILSNIWLCRKN